MESAAEMALIRMNFAAALRRDLAHRAPTYARREGLPHCLGYGGAPIVCLAPDEHDLRHGNFSLAQLPGDTRKARVEGTTGRKSTQQAWRSLRRTERGRWKELDTCASSDALLMNIFCHPDVLRAGLAGSLIGADPGVLPYFGYKARVPSRAADFIGRK
ncbi:MAG: hypothetical protein WB762_15585 [Candidatus Sulfotelmatobacter sp.]